ncbi:SAV0927 family protein [Bacillus daqingensis]|uniref:SAV0927 family protein n=1 Tax=Bacillus daqingensis TaxID=872396 RepID=A0ABV9NQH6_9BACI
MEFCRELYNVHEKADVQFIGVDIAGDRYDYAIIYSTMFFGKTLVICLHTGRQLLLDYNTLDDNKTLMEMFHMVDETDTSILASYFKKAMKPYAAMPPSVAGQ